MRAVKHPTENLELLEAIAANLADDGPIEVATMFRNPGLRTGTKIIVFLGKDNRLVAKIPRVRALELIDEGAATAVTMGTRTMREWIAVPAAADPEATLTRWLAIAREAFAYVRSESSH
jgi:hypothetical protein